MLVGGGLPPFNYCEGCGRKLDPVFLKNGKCLKCRQAKLKTRS